MNTENQNTKSQEEPDPTNKNNGGSEPELNKDFSEVPREDETENKETHPEVSDVTAENQETKGNSVADKSDSRRITDHGVENGDEDHQNPYPDEYDPTMKK